MDKLKEAKQVFATEIEALSKTKDALGDDFLHILEEVVSCEGKVVVTGMGKPGHIASKIAATFASLGTQSFFLHPAEAMHGDLGMISDKDIVIAISYSGESDEVVSLIPTIKLIGAKLIVITGNGKSTLAKAADVLQVLPEFEEACYMGLAPTSSTVVELAFGDALAVVASKIYGFGEKDFGIRHPAGALGKKILLKVSDVMAKGKSNSKVLLGTMLIDAIMEMSQKQLSMVCIVDDTNSLKGIMTDADLRRGLQEKIDIYNISVEKVMNSKPITVRKEMLAVDALQYMKEKSVNVMPVVSENGKLEGIVHWQQIVKSGIIA